MKCQKCSESEEQLHEIGEVHRYTKNRMARSRRTGAVYQVSFFGFNEILTMDTIFTTKRTCIGFSNQVLVQGYIWNC